MFLAPWSRSRSRLKKKNRSRSRLGKKIRSRSRLKKKSGAGAGAAKKFAGSPALIKSKDVIVFNYQNQLLETLLYNLHFVMILKESFSSTT